MAEQNRKNGGGRFKTARKSTLRKLKMRQLSRLPHHYGKSVRTRSIRRFGQSAAMSKRNKRAASKLKTRAKSMTAKFRKAVTAYDAKSRGERSAAFARHVNTNLANIFSGMKTRSPSSME